MKELNGRELSLYIKERQAHEVRRLRQSKKVFPKLAIVRTNPDPVVDSYMNLKQAYGADILVEVGIHTVKQADCIDTIKKLNTDDEVHAIIVQIPLPDPNQTDEVLNSVSPSKDVDGLGKNSRFDPATPMAINWLLAGYNVELSGKKIVIVGQGRLVGKPLAKIWRESNLDVEVADKTTNDLANVVSKADVLVSATGVPGLIKQEMIMPGMTIVDAGVATDSNGLVGDVAAEVRELKGITITPEKGGVGPLTVCALFENVITAARNIAETQ